jgi:hypothetical protein
VLKPNEAVFCQRCYLRTPGHLKLEEIDPNDLLQMSSEQCVMCSKHDEVLIITRKK